MKNLVKRIAFTIVSFILLGVGIYISGVEYLFSNFSKFPILSIFVILILLGINLVVVSFRLDRILNYFGFNLPYKIAFKATIHGNFVSLFLISLFGQVAGRQAVLKSHGTPSVFIASLTAVERIILLVVSGSLCLCGAFWLLSNQEIDLIVDKIPFFQMMLVFFLIILVFASFIKFRPNAGMIFSVRFSKIIKQFFKISGITIMAQLLILSAFVIAGLSLSPDVDVWGLFAASAITSFAASLPISINGWGVREVTAIYTFGLLGFPPASALSISILVGLCATSIVILSWLYALYCKRVNSSENTLDKENFSSISLEKIAAFGLVMGTAILIFFQIHVSLDGGDLNVNLSDGFAVLALVSVMMHVFYTRQSLKWVVPGFNWLLFAIGTLLTVSFANGALEIGITQWAMMGRLFGWFVLLGYLSIGVLAASYLGNSGSNQFLWVLTATAVIIIIFHSVTRWLVSSDILDVDIITPNFEGFSGNRNAFAFQLLTCLTLLISYTSSVKNGKAMIFGRFNVSNGLLFSISQGIILAGIVFTGSRSGMATAGIILAVVIMFKISDRAIIFKSFLYGACFWMTFSWLLPWASQLSYVDTIAQSSTIQATQSSTTQAVQSSLSTPYSNIERLQTIYHGLDMWLESPWIGAGLGVFIEKSTEWSVDPVVIHNTPVWILAEFGLLGFLVIFIGLCWVILFLFKTVKLKPNSLAAFLLIIMFLILGMAHDIFYQRIFWLALGVCLALPFSDMYNKHKSIDLKK